MPRTTAELLTLLDLEQIDDDLFRAGVEETRLPRVFGGQVAAQALVAAQRTTDPSYVVHSLHSYFLQPGDTAAPIIYDVESLRQGRSFATRRVLARQHGRPVFALTVDFHRPEDGPVHQSAMPEVPGPEECRDPRVLMGGAAGGFDEWDVVEFRYVKGVRAESHPDGTLPPGHQQLWLRVAQPLPDDPFLHAAAFTFASDMTLMGAAMRPHGYGFGDPRVLVASLDHSVWFHRPFAADRWWLFDQVSHVANGARGLVTAKVYSSDGLLVATVAQEGLLRPRDVQEDA